MRKKEFFKLKLNTKPPLGKQAGQVLIIFLLILVVGLAIVLSVASRSITDIRLTTTSEESNRAYFAAEAGIEEALKRLQDPSQPSTFTADLDFTALNQTRADISTSSLVGVDAFEFQNKVPKDGVVQVNLLEDFFDLGSVGYSGSELRIFWGRDVGDVPAVEVTVLYCNPCGANPTFRLRKFAFDPDSVRAASNGFCNYNAHPGVGSDTVDTNIGNGRNFEYSFNLRIRAGYSTGSICDPGVGGIGPAPANKAVLARIRLLYNDDKAHPVAVGEVSPGVLPAQGSEIESTGSTPSGVTRKLKVTQQFPALPPIFDYVLFSGDKLEK